MQTKSKQTLETLCLVSTVYVTAEKEHQKEQNMSSTFILNNKKIYSPDKINSNIIIIITYLQLFINVNAGLWKQNLVLHPNKCDSVNGCTLHLTAEGVRFI